MAFGLGCRGSTPTSSRGTGRTQAGSRRTLARVALGRPGAAAVARRPPQGPTAALPGPGVSPADAGADSDAGNPTVRRARDQPCGLTLGVLRKCSYEMIRILTGG